MKLLTNNMVDNVSGANGMKDRVSEMYFKDLAAFTATGIFSTTLAPIFGIATLIQSTTSLRNE